MSAAVKSRLGWPLKPRDPLSLHGRARAMLRCFLVGLAVGATLTATFYAVTFALEAHRFPWAKAASLDLVLAA